MAIQPLNIDLGVETPIYIQIVEQIRQQIHLGLIQPGEQLPTVRSVAQALKINFNTVSRAYRTLDDAGIISTQQGRGTYLLGTKDSENNDLLMAEQADESIVAFLARMKKLGVNPQRAIDMIYNHIRYTQETDG